LGAAKADRVHRRVKRPLKTAETIMGFAQAVDTDTNVVVADPGDAIDVGLVNQRPVGRQANVEAHGFCPAGDRENVAPQERFSA
jgi:hypothetical protein